MTAHSIWSAADFIGNAVGAHQTLERPKMIATRAVRLSRLSSLCLCCGTDLSVNDCNCPPDEIEGAMRTAQLNMMEGKHGRA